MKIDFNISVVFILAAALLAGCASPSDMQMLRQPAMPPVAVAKADVLGRLYHNVSLQDVEGAPEFRWFDGGAVITTRPTRIQVLKFLKDRLDKADLLAPSRIDSEYMLYVQFDELRGPDVWLGSDKLASAKITFRLVNWRTGQVIKAESIETSYRVKWSGFTPDQARAALVGPIGVTKESPIAPIGGLLGGLVVGYYVNDNLVVKIADAPLAAFTSSLQADEIGGPRRENVGFWTSLVPSVALGSARGHFTDFEAMMAGGLISAVGASAGPVPQARPVAMDDQVSSSLNGAKRRHEATRGLLDLAFDEFAESLKQDGVIVYKKAVSCAALNPNGTRTAVFLETENAYAVDCLESHYNNSQTTSRFPSHF